MNVDVFIDTNILVYAHDRDAGPKHVKAAELVEGFWDRQDIPCISVQVLQAGLLPTVIIATKAPLLLR